MLTDSAIIFLFLSRWSDQSRRDRNLLSSKHHNNKTKCNLSHKANDYSLQNVIM